MIMCPNLNVISTGRGGSGARACRTVSRESIPCGVSSEIFYVSELIEYSRTSEFSTTTNLYLGINKENALVLKGIVDPALHKTWPIFLNLAPDVHSSNVQLEMARPGGAGAADGGTCRLRTTKDLAAKSEFRLWFADEIVIMLNMPFLTPTNILGKNIYQCHICGMRFEYPNPLKIHLLLSCGKETSNVIWDRIAKANCEQYKPLNLSIERYTSANPGRNIYRNSSELNIRCLSEPPSSAFRPYKIRQLVTEYDNNNAVSMRMNQRVYFNSESPCLPGHSMLTPNSADSSLFQKIPWLDEDLRMKFMSLDEISQRRAAEVETLASNWGKSKQGHLCIYCGKVYSRKYGLKIHIRTHTGYKPLQCKYCNRPFGDPSNLNKHVRLHAHSETPYSCHICGKVLVRKRDLERHLKSRHDSRPYSSSMSPHST